MAGDRFCGACGTRAVDGDRFCGACGANLAEQEIPTATALAPISPAPETAARTIAAAVPGIGTLGRVLQAVTAVAMLGAVLVIVGALLAPTGEVLDPDAPWSASDTIVSAGGLLTLVAFLLGVVVTVVWVHRAYASLPALGIEGSRYRAHQAIWSWFVPFFGLVRPIQIVNDIYRGLAARSAQPGSAPVRFSPNADVAPIVPAWWAFLLGSGLVNRIFSDDQSTLGFLAPSAMVLLAGAAFILVVFRIDELHEQARRRAA